MPCAPRLALVFPCLDMNMVECYEHHGNPKPSVLGVITHISPYIGGLKPSFFFMVVGSKGSYYRRELWLGNFGL